VVSEILNSVSFTVVTVEPLEVDLYSPLSGVHYCLTQQFGIKGHISGKGDWKHGGNAFGISRQSYGTDNQDAL